MAKIVYPTKLHEALAQYPSTTFPKNADYAARFKRFEEEMIEYIHGEIEKGAAESDGTFLNKHDASHVLAVISKASELLGDNINRLTGYETYLFMVATHLHDSGNALGRKGHEHAMGYAVQFLGATLGHDKIEIGQIQAIAAAHGGLTKGSDKDTISKTLPHKTALNSQSIRPRLIAALLRFADELADDSSRASIARLETDTLPENAKLYHRYSDALHSVIVQPREIALKYCFAKDIALQKFKKQDSEVFLLDEIYVRTVKMHFEREYCMNFLRPLLDVDRITVTIEIRDEKFVGVLESVSYRLPESGYPHDAGASIETLRSGSALPSGVDVCQKLAGVTEGEDDV